MRWNQLLIAALAVPSNALVRFHCSQLVTQRLDPLVNPGQTPSSHVHQIVGGDSFNATMDPAKDVPGEATCTSCHSFSNYWTAVLYFRHQNGSYKRVPQLGNNQFRTANGGLTIYYMQDAIYQPNQTSKVTAFQPGFRMFIGDVAARTLEQAGKFRQLTYTCLDTFVTRSPELIAFPERKCAEGIMTSLRFPTCWDGKNLDSPDHASHMSYPETGTFESSGPCPATHPVRTAQVMYEVVWDTKPFHDLWPADGRNPFVWSFGDATGYANHADYVFGWKGDALQKILDVPCHFATNCSEYGVKMQSIDKMNACTQKAVVKEDIDGWLQELPGGFQASYGPTSA
ncbi:hypothetical protein K504DRAFT_420163 [Pleomassaria siparia CBS 279.74]|uniref:DUF1996 domain-containing protein n=1 Tax=Pleomassaria siparia CBS 279.74 TaxID=1314801 RepID=A0A6G1KPH9_9PLEO|nr:hypothetical protein K504DRAFT_420163 [Pleomassaria siparia CBS 279.74]